MLDVYVTLCAVSSPQLKWIYNFISVQSLLPLAVLQVSVRINEGGYTIIQLSFRTGLDHLQGFTLKRGSLRTKNTEYLSSLPFLSLTFLKTHLAWI